MRVIVLGNGFDIAHNIPSSYSDYKRFLLHCRRYNTTETEYLRRQDRRLKKTIDKYLGHRGINLWKDLEKATEPLHDLFYYHNDLKRNVRYDETLGYVDLSDEVIQTLDLDFRWIDDFQFAFDDWVTKLNNTNVSRIFAMPTDSSTLYCSFNYTNTPERVYGIDEQKIVYFHGKNDVENDSSYCSIGHNTKPLYPCIDQNSSELSYLSPESIHILEHIHFTQTQLYKDCNNNASDFIHNYGYFTSEITEIHVFGCSFNEIDFPYFQELKTITSADCNWKLYYFSENDRICAEVYKTRLELTECDILHSTNFFPMMN